MAAKKSDRVPKVYWDSSVWLAHLCQETEWPKEAIDAVSQVFEMMRKGDIVIVTSVLALLESVEKCKKGLAVSAEIEALKRLPAVHFIEISLQVAQEARNQMGNGLKYQDAIHAASAVSSFGCDQLWTFDKDFKNEVVEGSRRSKPMQPSLDALKEIKSMTDRPSIRRASEPEQPSLDMDDEPDFDSCEP